MSMGQITVEKNVAGIKGLCVITPAVHGDARGYFYESYRQLVHEYKGRPPRSPFSEAISADKAGAGDKGFCF